MKKKIGNAIKGVGLLHRLKSFWTTSYKSFRRLHLEYGDVIYDQPSNASFSNKIKSVQHYSALAI